MRLISRPVIVPLLVFAALLIGCGKSKRTAQISPSSASAPSATDTSTASSPPIGVPASARDADLIHHALEEHVRNDRGINMDALDMSVDSISVDGDEAHANATFRVRQGGAAMTMAYLLQRHGGAWIVVNSQPGGGQFVHPPVDKADSGAAPKDANPAMPDVQDFLKKHPASTN